MRKVIVLAVGVMVAMAVGACGRTFTVRDAIERQMSTYPESRVQDIYKNFCQDKLGPEHLIPNPEAARAYLLEEMDQYWEELEASDYESVGIPFYSLGDEGNYVRVDLSLVMDGTVDVETYLDGFVRGANARRNMTPEEWTQKWQEVAAVIRSDFSWIPDCERDLVRIDSLMAQGNYILHHSPEFGQAYQPHYRIFERGICQELFGN